MSNVLILISNYLPGTRLGGPVTSTKNLITSLSSQINFTVVTSDRDLNSREPYVNLSGNGITKNKYSIIYLKRDTFILIRIIKILLSKRFDVVQLNSFFDIYFSIIPIILNRFGLLKTKRLLLATRGELYIESLKFKSLKKRFYIFIYNCFLSRQNIDYHITSDEEVSGIRQNILGKYLIYNLENIPDLSLQPLSNYNSSDDKSLNVIWFARIAKDKNPLFPFKIFKKFKYPLNYFIYGPIEDKLLWEKCLVELPKMGKNICIKYCGIGDMSEKEEIFSRVDLLFLPSFSENYGNVIVESLLLGVPVLISDNTPWKNLVLDNLGYDINLNDENKFLFALDEFYYKKQNKNLLSKDEIRAKFLNRIDYKKSIKKYMDYYNSIL